MLKAIKIFNTKIDVIILTIGLINALFFILESYQLVTDFDLFVKNIQEPEKLIRFSISFLAFIGLFIRSGFGWIFVTLPFMVEFFREYFYIMPFSVNPFSTFWIFLIPFNIFFALINSRNAQVYFKISLFVLILLNVISGVVCFYLARYSF